MNVSLDRAHGTLNDQFYAHGCGKMKDDIALVDQLSRDWLVVNVLNRVVKARMIL